HGTPWRAVEPPDGTFTAKLPGVRLFERKGETSMTWTSMAGHTQCMIQEFRDAHYSAANAAAFLRDYPNPGSTGIHGKGVESSTVQSGRFTGRSVRIEGLAHPGNTPVVHLARAFVADGRLYVVSANAAQGQLNTSIANEFFNSFELKK